MGFTNFYLGHGAPTTEGKTKGQWASLPSGLCAALMPHHQGFTSPYLFDPVWSSYWCPLVHELCKKKRKEKNWDRFPFFHPPTPHYLSPTLFLPPQSILPPSLPPSPTSTPPGPSPGFHPSRPATTGVYVSVREFVWDQSFYFFSFFFLPLFSDWLPARTVKALPAARTWKMHRISLW